MEGDSIMAKIKWKTESEIQAERQKEELKKQQKERFKGKASLTALEKDALLLQMAKDLGYIDGV
jgi:hypothetical protein